MRNIQLSESETTELVHFYQLELDKILKKAETITTLLQKLTGKATRVGRPKAVHAKPSMKPKRIRRTKAQLAAARKQQGAIPAISSKQEQKVATRKINPPTLSKQQWDAFIPETIKFNGKPMSAKEILNLAVKKFEVPDSITLMKQLAQRLVQMKKGGVITSHKTKSKRYTYDVVS